MPLPGWHRQANYRVLRLNFQVSLTTFLGQRHWRRVHFKRSSALSCPSMLRRLEPAAGAAPHLPAHSSQPRSCRCRRTPSLSLHPTLLAAALLLRHVAAPALALFCRCSVAPLSLPGRLPPHRGSMLCKLAADTICIFAQPVPSWLLLVRRCLDAACLAAVHTPFRPRHTTALACDARLHLPGTASKEACTLSLGAVGNTGVSAGALPGNSGFRVETLHACRAPTAAPLFGPAPPISRGALPPQGAIPACRSPTPAHTSSQAAVPCYRSFQPVSAGEAFRVSGLKPLFRCTFCLKPLFQPAFGPWKLCKSSRAGVPVGHNT